jgi:hypothetical protein
LESTDSNFANHLTDFEVLRAAQNGLKAIMIDNEKLDMVLDGKLESIVLTQSENKRTLEHQMNRLSKDLKYEFTIPKLVGPTIEYKFTRFKDFMVDFADKQNSYGSKFQRLDAQLERIRLGIAGVKEEVKSELSTEVDVLFRAGQEESMAKMKTFQERILGQGHIIGEITNKMHDLDHLLKWHKKVKADTIEKEKVRAKESEAVRKTFEKII